MQEHKDKKPEKAEGHESWAVVATVANDIEFEMVAGLLSTAEIPCVRKVRGVDGYLQVILGVPIAGIDVLVPPDKEEEAHQLLESQVEGEELES